jgi:hypothetical protein
MLVWPLVPRVTMTMKVRLVSGLPPAHPAHGFAREFDGFGFLTPSIHPPTKKNMPAPIGQ